MTGIAIEGEIWTQRQHAQREDVKTQEKMTSTSQGMAEAIRS